MTPCVLHVGRLRADGYGEVGRHDRAHVVAWEAANGPVPSGLVLDHICHNVDASCPGGNKCSHRACVKVDHLEAVTRGENTARGKSPKAIAARTNVCVRGHALVGDNVVSNGHARTCRTCRAEMHADWQRRNRERLNEQARALYAARKKDKAC